MDSVYEYNISSLNYYHPGLPFAGEIITSFGGGIQLGWLTAASVAYFYPAWSCHLLFWRSFEWHNKQMRWSDRWPRIPNFNTFLKLKGKHPLWHTETLIISDKCFPLMDQILSPIILSVFQLWAERQCS